MKTVVVDASVAAKMFLPEAGSAAAIRLLNGRYRLAAPELIRAEVGNLLWKLQSRRLLGTEESQEILEHFLSLPIEIHDSEFLLSSALEIAIATQRTVYDSLYLSLAMEIKGVVVTADARWAHSLAGGPFAKYVQLLGE